MTTIAYKNRIIATDACWTGGGLVISKRSKIDRLKNGIIVGQAGDNDGRAILRCLEKISTPDELPTGEELVKLGVDCSCIVIFPQSWRVFFLEINLEVNDRKAAQFYETDRKFVAVGSGSHLAMGAMAAGKSAKQAIEIACEYDYHSRLPVHSEKLST